MAGSMVGIGVYGLELDFVCLYCYIPFLIVQKFFITGGDILLELNNRANADGTESWVPVTKKVYWPPPGPVKAESSPSVHSGKFFIFCRHFFIFYFGHDGP